MATTRERILDAALDRFGTRGVDGVSLDDIAALRDLVPQGLEGAIVGKALYAGAFTLAEALDVASE